MPFNGFQMEVSLKFVACFIGDLSGSFVLCDFLVPRVCEEAR